MPRVAQQARKRSRGTHSSPSPTHEECARRSVGGGGRRVAAAAAAASRCMAQRVSLCARKGAAAAAASLPLSMWGCACCAWRKGDA